MPSGCRSRKRFLSENLRTCKGNEYLACYRRWSSNSSCRCVLTGYRNWIWIFKRWWMNQGWLLPQQERRENLGRLLPQQERWENLGAITTSAVTGREPQATTTSTVSLRESWITSAESLSGKSVRGRFNWTREGLGLDKKQKILGSINWTGLGLEMSSTG